MEGNPLIAITVELDRDEYPAADLPWHRQQVKRAIELAVPGAHVSVRSGTVQWFDANDEHSRRV